MSRYIIGIDPDSSKHGVAVYFHGELVRLESMSLMTLLDYIKETSDLIAPHTFEVHIEDVCAKKAVWHAKKEILAVKLMSAQRVGMCKQAQREVEFMAEYLGVKVVKHPISSTWKSQAGKKQFQAVTGWPKSGNEDTRSAAYFGWLGVTSNK